jgi:hypothetical protein
MGDSKIRIAILTATFVLACAVSFTFATKVEARGPTVAEVSADDVRVGGEPGEDPHLKLVPRIECAEDLNRLGSSCGSGAGAQRVGSIQAEGFREGAEPYLGSRMSHAWQMMLQAWFWTMHR